MADAMLSVAVERLAAIVAEQIKKEVNLVRCVDKEIRNLSKELNKVGRVLHDAYKKEFKDDSVKDWLKRLEETSYEMDDVLDEWNMALHRLQMEQSNDNVVPPPKNKVLSCIPSLCLCFKEVAIPHDIAKKMENCFDLRIWICVSDPFDEFKIAKGIVEGVEKGSSPNTDQLEMLLECLRESISGKKFLLVLDDVWSEDNTKWEPLEKSLRCGGGGSKILVTTRNQRVAIKMGSTEIHELKKLSHEYCWSLLRRSALPGKSDQECVKFEKIGKDIAKRCKGLPLAAKTLGGLLRFKNTLIEWENVLNSEMWELEEVEVELFPHLLLSYNELSPTLKQCFSYCAVFPKDTMIDVEILITQWMALGYLGSNRSSAGDSWEDRGREYFHKIAMRFSISRLQIFG